MHVSNSLLKANRPRTTPSKRVIISDVQKRATLPADGIKRCKGCPLFTFASTGHGNEESARPKYRKRREAKEGQLIDELSESNGWGNVGSTTRYLWGLWLAIDGTGWNANKRDLVMFCWRDLVRLFARAHTCTLSEKEDEKGNEEVTEFLWPWSCSFQTHLKWSWPVIQMSTPEYVRALVFGAKPTIALHKRRINRACAMAAVAMSHRLFLLAWFRPETVATMATYDLAFGYCGGKRYALSLYRWTPSNCLCYFMAQP